VCQPIRCRILCASLIPAAPPSNIQKSIINRGANGGGVGGVANGNFPAFRLGSPINDGSRNRIQG
jgi:hypothetical protein